MSDRVDHNSGVRHQDGVVDRDPAVSRVHGDLHPERREVGVAGLAGRVRPGVVAAGQLDRLVGRNQPPGDLGEVDQAGASGRVDQPVVAERNVGRRVRQGARDPLVDPVAESLAQLLGGAAGHVGHPAPTDAGVAWGIDGRALDERDPGLIDGRRGGDDPADQGQLAAALIGQPRDHLQPAVRAHLEPEVHRPEGRPHVEHAQGDAAAVAGRAWRVPVELGPETLERIGRSRRMEAVAQRAFILLALHHVSEPELDRVDPEGPRDVVEVGLAGEHRLDLAGRADVPARDGVGVDGDRLGIDVRDSVAGEVAIPWAGVTWGMGFADAYAPPS